MDSIFVKNIFASVNQKQALNVLLKVLDKKSVNFWGTEGTVKYLNSKGFSVKSVVAGFDFDGRVKSLDKKVFAAVLADRSKRRHTDELKRLKVEPVDLVVIDLYATAAKNFPETMDIGGQTLIRAAVKNYENVALAFDTKSIQNLVSELKNKGGSTTLQFRKNQADSAAKFIADRCFLEARFFTEI